MSVIEVSNVTLRVPVHDAGARHLRNRVVSALTGGRLERANNHAVTVTVLRDITFTVEPGDRLALVGRNGAGKSSLLRLLAGIYTPTSGSVRAPREIATLFDASLDVQPDATGYENVRLMGLMLGLDARQIADLMPDIEAFTDLGEYLSMPVRIYSAGMRLRLAFAIATSISARVLLVDEIITVGDAAFLDKARARFEGLMQRCEAVILTTHVESVIRDLCNKALLLDHGELIYAGEVDAVLDRYHQRLLAESQAG
jgi:ABC-type polysaccharide/polyol phosphate transport system ATPase subunit